MTAARSTESPPVSFVLSMPVPGLHDAAREGLCCLKFARPPQLSLIFILLQCWIPRIISLIAPALFAVANICSAAVAARCAGKFSWAVELVDSEVAIKSLHTAFRD